MSLYLSQDKSLHVCRTHVAISVGEPFTTNSQMGLRYRSGGRRSMATITTKDGTEI